MINEDKVKLNSLKAWLLASRPKTLTGAVIPVFIGISLAISSNDFQINIVPALLCLFFALAMQIDANFINDYFDWRKGNDDVAKRLGPLRACSMGWVTPKAMINAIIITTLIACLVGLPLVLYGGMKLILIGMLCILFCVLYTTTLSYIGLGDLLVLVFFGIIPVCLTFYIQLGYLNFDVFFVSLACGLAIDNLLLVNNYRDIDNDKRDGKKTLIVFVGRKWGLRLYLITGFFAAAIMIYYANFSVKSLLLFLYLLPHFFAYKKMKELEGRALNRVLGMTARNILIFGIITSLIILL